MTNITGFDIQKKKVEKKSEFNDLIQYSRNFFFSIFTKNLFFILILHYSLFWLLHFFYFKSELTFGIISYSTLINTGELLTTNLICSLVIMFFYFFSSLFREKNDYARINAWYIIGLLYAFLIFSEVFWLEVKPSWLLLNSFLVMFIAITFSHILSIFIKD